MIIRSVNFLITYTLFCLLLGVSHSVIAATCTADNNPKNIAACTALADKGDAKAQDTLGQIYYADALNIKGYHAKARVLFEKAAAQGLAEAQYNLGAIYRDEFNNFPVALEWFEKAAAQGNADAQNSIGYIYENAFGGKTPRHYFFDEAGKNNDPELPYLEAKFAPYEFQLPVARYPRAIYPITEYGQGVERDLQQALQWYQKAANQEHALAQTNLAYFYLMGIGVDKDEKHAFKLYQAAAKQNFAPAIRSLAFMYTQGLGTQPDMTKAFNLLQQAYTLQPDNNLWEVIRRMKNRHHLTVSAQKKDPIFRERFKYKNSSDEDYLYENFHYLNAFYRLDLINGDQIEELSIWSRTTQPVLLGETIGDNSILKERYLLKKSLQGYYEWMRLLSYYYKAEEGDMPKAQLWRQYAIKMGEIALESYWPGYDDSPNSEE